MGVAIGLAGAFALTRVICSLLFNIDPLDGLTFAISVTVLLPIAVVSSYLPARRALRVDPLSRCGRSDVAVIWKGARASSGLSEARPDTSR